MAQRLDNKADKPLLNFLVEPELLPRSHSNQLRRGIFRDDEELIMAIEEYIDKHNDNPKPFVWTAKATHILEKVKRARKALDIA